MRSVYALSIKMDRPSMGRGRLSGADIPLPQADIALRHADIPLPQADIALRHADIALPQADIPLPQADIALPHADIAPQQADIPLPQADIALRQADIPLPQADIAPQQADIPLPQADTDVQRNNNASSAGSNGDRRWSRGLSLIFLFLLCVVASAQTVTVGSKKFTESYVLGEMLKKVIADAGVKVEHRQGMGATGIVWEALKRGDVTMYPEYTGTLWTEILKREGRPTMQQLRDAVKPLGIGISDPLGFNNTYALVMKSSRADNLGISKISDIRKYPLITAGPDPEFLGRADGWKPLVARYGLKFGRVQSLDHGLVYQALDRGDIDISVAYSTDAGIADFNLRVLEDDLEYFPAYKAIVLFRLDAPPAALEAMRKLEGKIDDRTMTELNAEAERTKDFTAAARKFFADTPTAASTGTPKSGWDWGKILALTGQHLKLVGISLLLAVLIGFPLGIVASRGGAAGTGILGVAGIIQTIPALALLGFLVPLMGITMWTAILALFLYSLLPIIRNTATGLQAIPGSIRESAAALGLENSAQLAKVYIPMATRTILAGVKTSAVINVGTATLAALIGGGGLGEPIVSGLALVDRDMILQGAVPAAALALLVQFLFEGLDRLLIPRGLR